MKPSEKKNGHVVAIVAMFCIYAMISFVTNLAAPIGTIWGYKFAGNSVLGMMGNMMNFLAYLFMGIPAGNLLVKIGYKKTALWAMAVGFVGLFVQWLSSVTGAETVVGEIWRQPCHTQFLHLSARCLYLRFLCLHAQHSRMPDAQPARRGGQDG